MTNQQIQQIAIRELEKRKFKIVHSHFEFPESDITIYHLSKRTKTGAIHATVDGEGMVNGESINDFILTLTNN